MEHRLFYITTQGVFRMKNKTRVLVIALLVMAMIPACAQQYNAESDFTVKVVDGGKGVEITGYKGDRFDVRIPPRIQNLPVIAITYEGDIFISE
jgi:hypothetical protein